MAVKKVVKGIKLGTNILRTRFAFIPTKIYDTVQKKNCIILFQRYKSLYTWERSTLKSTSKWVFKSRTI